MPVKNRARIITSRGGRIYMRGFKRDRIAFHQSEKEFPCRLRCRRRRHCGVAASGTSPGGTTAPPCVPLPFHGVPDYRSSAAQEKQHFIRDLTVAGRCAVPGRGLEPLWISPPDPKSGASANFATLANTSWFATYDKIHQSSLRVCWQYIDAILRRIREPLANLSASLNNLVTQFGKER